ncbi:proteasome subunit alpha type-5-like [Teleopsis dalmanni]|uniref:proteasome subunit alpha type-5-like n=1 Tax=Teleopsis dalmanni TaxID=139649 RepID=UPI0018CDE020|nr:proteasome subunit alpha type-5-like [Teleopsis dalmanni]
MFTMAVKEFAVGYKELIHSCGTNAIGIQTSEGVILAIEKGLTYVVDIPSKSKEVWKIGKPQMCVASGPCNEIPEMVNYARSKYDQTESNRLFARTLYVNSLISRSNVCLLLAGLSLGIKCELWCVNIQGMRRISTYIAIGPGQRQNNMFLYAKYKPGLTLDEGLNLALLALQHTMKKKFKSYNIGLAQITKNDLIYIHSYVDIEHLLERLKINVKNS